MEILPIQEIFPGNKGSKAVSGNAALPRQQIEMPLSEGADLREVCAEFEALFLNHLLKGMRATIPDSGENGMGQSKEMYEAMMDEQLARELAVRGGGIGLADMLYRQLSLQEGEEKVRDSY